jgi:hypothetical protein
MIGIAAPRNCLLSMTTLCLASLAQAGARSIDPPEVVRPNAPVIISIEPYEPWDPTTDSLVAVPIPPGRVIGMVGLLGLGLYIRGRRRNIAVRAAAWPPSDP